MNQKLTIGFLLQTDSNWMGGVYYVLNLIKAISNADSDKIIIQVYYHSPLPLEIDEALSGLNLLHVDLSKMNLIKKAVLRLIQPDNPRRILSHFLKRHRPDIIYPLLSFHKTDTSIFSRCIYWIPDFQHKFLPDLFSEEELNSRDKQFQQIADNAAHLVLSSHDSLRHFKQFYPQSKAKLEVLQFLSLIEDKDLSSDEKVRQKFDIRKPYFLVCNQFWTHKNHILVLDAIKMLKDRHLDYEIIFTGKPHDHRDPYYYGRLTEFIQKNDLNSFVRFLGFIDRCDQLALMRDALTVIQPSLFEGWSTVIEDAKTLGKPVMASDIPIHREQLKENSVFFDSKNACELADLISKKLNEMDSVQKVKISLELNDLRNVEYGQRLISLFQRLGS